MKFSVKSQELLSHLQIAQGVVSNNPVLPILHAFLFEMQNNQLTISATDLETSISTSLPVTYDEEFQVAIPARILVDTLKQLPDQPIQFVINKDNYTVEMTSSHGKYKLAGSPGKEYPDIRTPEVKSKIKIKGETLVQAIQDTLFAASSDEHRPTMTGVLFEISSGSMVCVATDAQRLVKLMIGLGGNLDGGSFIVPKKSLGLLKNILPKDQEVFCTIEKSHIYFSSEGFMCACRLIEGRFPEYNAVIPSNNPIHITVNRMDLLQSLKRTIIYSNQSTYQVTFHIKDGIMKLTAQDIDYSNEANEEVPCQQSGNEIRIGFNCKFLIEMLGVLDSTEVRLELDTPSRAGILKPVENKSGQDLLMLIMPFVLN